MSVAESLIEGIHARALELSAQYRRVESELIEILAEADRHRVYIRRGHSSLFAYVTAELALSESVAYTLITVMRKSSEVPELRAEITKGTLSLTNARRIASVISSENKGEWIEKASTLSSRQLEKEIVWARPMEATREKASYVTPDRVKLELGLSEREMLRLRRAQDLVSKSMRRTASLEETVAAVVAEYLRRHDPVEKAKRHHVRKGTTINPSEGPGRSNESAEEGGASVDAQAAVGASAKADVPAEEKPWATVGKLVARRVRESPASNGPGGRRHPIPAAVIHQVNLRDQGRCTATLPSGRRCNQARWTEIHHVILVSQGGPDTTDNLTTLCWAHHRKEHIDETG